MRRWGRNRKADDPLAHLPRRTRERLARAGDRFEVASGDQLLAPNTRVRWTWIVLAGELVVESDFRVETVGRGRQWGATQLLVRDRRRYSVTARTDASVLAVPERELSCLLGTDVAFAEWMTHTLARDSLALRDELVLQASWQVAA